MNMWRKLLLCCVLGLIGRKVIGITWTMYLLLVYGLGHNFALHIVDYVSLFYPCYCFYS